MNVLLTNGFGWFWYSSKPTPAIVLPSKRSATSMTAVSYAVAFCFRDAAGYAQHFAQLTCFLSAEFNRERFSTVYRYRQGISKYTEVVLSYALLSVARRSYYCQTVQVQGHLVALYFLRCFERYVERFAGFTSRSVTSNINVPTVRSSACMALFATAVLLTSPILTPTKSSSRLVRHSVR
jgi:hypothetical protein